jgi:DNA-binding NarL/FixJ family response regulator
MGSPSSPRDGGADDAREGEPPDGSRPRVVLADDHPSLLTAIERLLSWSCDVVGTVTTGGELLEAVRRLHPDVVVIDLRLPDMSGLEACRQLKDAGVTARTILLTAADDPEIRRSAYSSGAAAFVAKHRAAEELLPTIARLFDGGPAPSKTPTTPA